VDISLESLREKHFHGKVRALFSNESQFWAHLEVEGLPPEVLPGMTADVAIEVNRKDNVILVPASGVSGGQVLRSRSGTREQVVVEPGISDGAWVEVRSGDVKPGDQIWVANPPAK
jgi:macrolide-specific efflux system membrane fusion protein